MKIKYYTNCGVLQYSKYYSKKCTLLTINIVAKKVTIFSLLSISPIMGNLKNFYNFFF